MTLAVTLTLGILIGIILAAGLTYISYKAGHRKGAIEVANYVHQQQLERVQANQKLESLLSSLKDQTKPTDEELN